jgi:hypothetical protein
MCALFHAAYLGLESYSGLLILGLTLDRFIMIHRPLRRFQMNAWVRAIKTIVCLLLIAIIVGVLEGLMWSFDGLSCTIRLVLPSKIMKVWNMLLLCFGILLPMLFIIVLNVVIAHALLLVSKKREQLTHQDTEHSSDQLQHLQTPAAAAAEALHRGSPHRVHKSDMDGTLILLCLSMYLVLSECPDAVVYLLRPFYLPNASGSESFCQYSKVSLCLETFALSNYAVNVLIYSLAGRRFRACLRKHIVGS